MSWEKCQWCDKWLNGWPNRHHHEKQSHPSQFAQAQAESAKEEPFLTNLRWAQRQLDGAIDAFIAARGDVEKMAELGRA